MKNEARAWLRNPTLERLKAEESDQSRGVAPPPLQKASAWSIWSEA